MYKGVIASMAVAGTLSVLVALTGCAGAPSAGRTPSPTATPTPIADDSPVVTASPAPSDMAPETFPRAQRDYATTVAKFPLSLPEGWVFPARVPFAGDGTNAAFDWWRCAVTMAADRAESMGDYRLADSLLADVPKVTDAELPGNPQWVHNVIGADPPGMRNGSLEGESGVCYYRGVRIPTS